MFSFTNEGTYENYEYDVHEMLINYCLINRLQTAEVVTSDYCRDSIRTHNYHSSADGLRPGIDVSRSFVESQVRHQFIHASAPGA